MNITQTKPIGLSPDVQEDTDAILAHWISGQPIEPHIAKRIRDRGDRIREKVFKEQGVLDIGTPAIREFRDE